MPTAIVTLALFVVLSLLLFWSTATIDSSDTGLVPTPVSVPTLATPAATP